MAGSRRTVREQESTEGRARDIESVKVLGSDSRSKGQTGEPWIVEVCVEVGVSACERRGG